MLHSFNCASLVPLHKHNWTSAARLEQLDWLIQFHKSSSIRPVFPAYSGPVLLIWLHWPILWVQFFTPGSGSTGVGPVCVSGSSCNHDQRNWISATGPASGKYWPRKGRFYLKLTHNSRARKQANGLKTKRCFRSDGQRESHSRPVQNVSDEQLVMIICFQRKKLQVKILLPVRTFLSENGKRWAQPRVFSQHGGSHTNVQKGNKCHKTRALFLSACRQCDVDFSVSSLRNISFGCDWQGRMSPFGADSAVLEAILVAQARLKINVHGT